MAKKNYAWTCLWDVYQIFFSPHTVKTDIRSDWFSLHVLSNFLSFLFSSYSIFLSSIALSSLPLPQFLLPHSSFSEAPGEVQALCVSVRVCLFLNLICIHSHLPPKLQQALKRRPFELHGEREREREREREKKQVRKKAAGGKRGKEKQKGNERAMALHACICVCFHISL